MTARFRRALCALVLLLIPSAVQAQAGDLAIEHAEAFNQGQELAQRRAYDQAYEQFSQALKLAEEADDPLYTARARSVLAQLDYLRGSRALRDAEPEAALEHFDLGIAHRPQYARNYFGKAEALRSLGRFDEALGVLLEAREMEDDADAFRVEEEIRQHFLDQSSRLLTQTDAEPTAEEAREALAVLERLHDYAAPDERVQHQMWLIRRLYLTN